MQKESRKEMRGKQIRENAELARNRIKFDCFGLDYFGMVRLAKIGASIQCKGGNKCLHKCKFRKDFYVDGEKRVVREVRSGGAFH